MKENEPQTALPLNIKKNLWCVKYRASDSSNNCLNGSAGEKRRHRVDLHIRLQVIIHTMKDVHITTCVSECLQTLSRSAAHPCSCRIQRSHKKMKSMCNRSKFVSIIVSPVLIIHVLQIFPSQQRIVFLRINLTAFSKQKRQNKLHEISSISVCSEFMPRVFLFYPPFVDITCLLHTLLFQKCLKNRLFRLIQFVASKWRI